MCGGFVGKITGLDKLRDKYLKPLGLGMGWIGDFTEDANDYLFHGGFEDDIRNAGRWIDEEIHKPIYEFQKGIVDGIMEDPFKFIFDAVMIVATGGAYLAYKWAVDAAYVLAQGGSFSDALKTAAISYVAGNYAPQIGGAIGAKAADFASTISTSAGFQAIVGNMVTEGVTQGTVTFISGGNFGEGFVNGVFMAGAQMATSKVMGYIEEKGGFNFEETQYDNKGNVLTESVTNPITGVTELIPKVDLKIIPQVAQDLISASVAAELQGKEITSEMLAGVATQSLVTSKFVTKTLDNISGVDWNSETGQEYIGVLMPAIHRSVANVLVNGVNEESGRATADYMLEAMDDYSQQQLFDEVGEFMASIDIVDSASNIMKKSVDVVTGQYKKVNEKLGELREVDNETLMLLNERNEYVGQFKADEDAYNLSTAEFEAKYPQYIEARDRWVAGLKDPVKDSYGNVIGHAGIESGLEEFGSPAELYAYTMEQLGDSAAPDYREIRREEERLLRMVGNLNSLNAELSREIQPIDLRLAALEADKVIILDELQPLENDLVSDIDVMNENLTPLVDLTNKANVKLLAPDFDPEEYRRLNGIDVDVDAYVHYLNEGVSTGAFTSDIQREAIADRSVALFKDQIMQGVGGKNASVQDLTSAQLAEFNDLVDSYVQSNFVDDLGNLDTSKLMSITYYDADGNVTSKSNSNSYTITVPDAFVSGVSQVASQFDTKLNQDFQVSDLETLITSSVHNKEPIELAEGVDWVDVLTGGGIGYNPVTGRKEYVSKLTNDEGKDVTMWDAMSGAVDTIVDGGVSLQDIRRENPETFWEFMANIGPNIKADYIADMAAQNVAIDERNARAAAELDAIIEGSKRFVGTSAFTLGKIVNSYKESRAELSEFASTYTLGDLVSSIDAFYEANIAVDPNNVPIDFEDTRGYKVYKNLEQGGKTVVALTDEAIANFTQHFNGLLYVVADGLDKSGIEHTIDRAYIENTRLNRWAKGVMKVAEGAKSEGWKENTKALNEMLSVRAEDDPSTPYVNEAVWGTMQIIGGALEEHPTEFLGDVLYKELVEEGITLVGGGLAGVVGKTAAKAYAKENARLWATRVGVTTAGALDVAESAGGTAGGAYDEAYKVVKDVITARRDAGYYKYTDEKIADIADAYAMDMAQKNAYFAGMTTLALMKVGGLALEKSRLGDKFDIRDKNGNIKAFDAYSASVWSDFTAWAAKTGKVATKEMFSEFTEEALITNNLEGMLLEWDPNRNVTGNVLFNGFMGTVVAGPITGTLEGIGSLLDDSLPDYQTLTGNQPKVDTGNVMANLLLTVNSDTVRAMGGMNMSEGGERDLFNDFADIGLDYSAASALINTANDAQWLSQGYLNFPDGEVDTDFGELPAPNFTTFPTSNGDSTAVSSLHYDPATRKTYQPFGYGASVTWIPVSDRDIALAQDQGVLVEGSTFTDKITGARFKVGIQQVDGQDGSEGKQGFTQLFDDPINPGTDITYTAAKLRDERVVQQWTRYTSPHSAIVNEAGTQYIRDASILEYPPGSGTILSVDDYYNQAARHFQSFERIQSQKLKGRDDTPYDLNGENGKWTVFDPRNPNAGLDAGSLTERLHGAMLFDGERYIKDTNYGAINTSVPNFFDWDETNSTTYVNYTSGTPDSPIEYKQTSGPLDSVGYILTDPRTREKYWLEGKVVQSGPNRMYGHKVFKYDPKGSAYNTPGPGSQMYEPYTNAYWITNRDVFSNDVDVDYLAARTLDRITEMEERQDPNSTLRDEAFFRTDATGGEFDFTFNATLTKVDDYLRSQMTKVGMSHDQIEDYIYSKTREEHAQAITDGEVFNDPNGDPKDGVFANVISLDDARTILRDIDSSYEPTLEDLRSVSTNGMSMDDYLNTSAEDIQAAAVRNATDLIDPDSADSKMTIDEWKQFVQDDLGWTEEQAYNYAQDYGTELQASLDYNNKTQAQFKQQYTSLFDGMVISEEEAAAEYARLYPDYTPTAADIQAVMTGANATSYSSEAAMTATLNSAGTRNRIEAEIARIAQEQGDRDEDIDTAETAEERAARLAAEEAARIAAEEAAERAEAMAAARAATLARIQDIRDSASMPEDNSGGPIGYGKYVGPYPEIANPYAPGSSEAANFERELAILNASGLHPDSYYYDYHFNRTVNNAVVSSNQVLDQFADRFFSQSTTVADVEDYVRRSGYVPGTNEYADVLEYYLDRVPLGYQPHTTDGHWDTDTEAARKQAESYARYKDVYEEFEILVGRAPSTGEATYWGGKTEEELRLGLRKLVEDEERNYNFQRTVTTGESQALLITRFGMSNMTWDAEQGKNVPNQEMADIIARHFDVGVGAQGSRRERLDAGVDSYRTELIEDEYGITPTPEQLERLRDATTTQWMNDPEILQARRDLAAANNAKTLSPMELGYYLSDLGLSYDSDDGIYKAIMGMGFTGEGGPDFDATQRADIAAEVTRLKEVYDAENDATQQLADTKQAFIDAGYTPTDSEVEQFLTDNAGIPDFITNTVKPRVKQAFIDAGYTPSEQDITDYINNTAGIAGFVQGKRNDTAALFGDYTPSEQDITDYLNNNAGVAGFVEGKRNDTKNAFSAAVPLGSYTPTAQEVTDYLNDNTGIAQFMANKKDAMQDKFDHYILSEFERDNWLGKSDNQLKTLERTKRIGIANAFKNFNGYVATEDEITAYINNQGGIPTYLEPVQYVRADVVADLEAELGRALTEEEKTSGPYYDFINSMITYDGSRTDAQGKTQVESDITNAADVKSYLEGLGYDTTGLSNEQLLAFAGTGLGIDLNTATADYKADNETIEETAARLAAEAVEARKRAETRAAFGDYNPSEAEVTAYLDNNAGIAQYVDDNTITEAEVKKSLEDQGFVVPESFFYEAFTGKKPESGLAAATQGWRDGNTVTEAEVKKALEDQDFVVPEDFNYDAFTGKNKPDSQIKSQVDTYLAPLQYTRADAEAALAAELGRSLTAEDLTTYKDYLDGLVDMTGETTDVLGDAAVQNDVTTEQDVRDYLSDYTLGVDFSFDDLTGLGVDLDTELGDFKANNRTTEQNKLAADLDAAGWTGASNADIAAIQDLDPAGLTAWVADRQFTEDQAIAALLAQGITADHPQFQSLVDQLVVDKGDAGTPATQGALVDDAEDALVDQYIITQDEIDTAFGGYPDFDATGAPDFTGVIDESTLASTVSEHVGNNYVTTTQAREALNGIDGIDALAVDDTTGEYVITDAQLTEMGLVGQYNPADLVTKVDGATVTEEEINEYLVTQGFDPAVEGTFPTTISTDTAENITAQYRDDNEVTYDEIRQALADELGVPVENLFDENNDPLSGYSDAELALVYTQGTNVLQSGLADEIAGNTGTGTDPRVGDIIDAFGTQGTTTAGPDGELGTEDDVVVSATGIYGIIDQVAQGVLTNEEAITALQGAVGVPATYAEDGVTVLTPATGIYAQSGEGVNADVLQAINAVYDYVGEADFASNDMVQQVADLLGKPADLVTQDDIDMATSIFGDFEGTYLPMADPAPEYAEGQVDSYDVNNDGYIDQTDVDLLTELYGGVDAAYNNVVEGLPEGSRFDSTGVFGILDQQNRNQAAANEAITNQAEIDARTNAETLAEINTQINTNINVQNQRYLQELLAEEARLGGSRRIDTTNKDPGDIEYMYDFEGIFANQGQEDLYGNLFGGDGFGLRKKAAATGGLIDSTDELLKILGK